MIHSYSSLGKVWNKCVEHSGAVFERFQTADFLDLSSSQGVFVRCGTSHIGDGISFMRYAIVCSFEGLKSTICVAAVEE
jgi:hypothetical protein